MDPVHTSPGAPFSRRAHTIAGVVLALIALAPGVPLPLMIPLLIASEYCLAQGDGRMYKRFMAHRLLGSWLRAYKENGISLRAKLIACASVTIWIAFLLVITDGYEWEYMAAYLVAAFISIMLLVPGHKPLRR